MTTYFKLIRPNNTISIREFSFRADTPQDASEWLAALSACIGTTVTLENAPAAYVMPPAFIKHHIRERCHSI